MMQTVFEFALGLLLLVGAAYDLRSFRLPNWLTLVTAILFVPWALVALPGIWEFGLHLIAGGLALALGTVLFRFDILGGGDVKWLAALILWIGPTHALARFLVLVGFGGGLLALVVILVVRITGSSYGRIDGRQHLPYGVAIALAGLDFIYKNLSFGAFLKDLS
jgi:prepilin peptidase CpaA